MRIVLQTNKVWGFFDGNDLLFLDFSKTNRNNNINNKMMKQ